MGKDKARVAIIGTGWWSTYTHIPGLQANTDAELVALCDSDEAKLQAAAQAFGVARTYTDYRTLLDGENLDGVIIATNHAAHYEPAKYALEHGLHVMLEKPMTLYAAEARELVELSKAQGRELIIGYPYNYLPYIRRAREVISSGALGAVQYVVSNFSTRIVDLLRGEDHAGAGASYPVHGPGAVYSQPSKSGGGMGHLQITHSAGLLCFVSGLRASRVLALMNKHGLALDLVDALTVEFDNGALGIVGGTGNGYIRKIDLQVHCELGGIDIDVVAGTCTIHGPGDAQEVSEPVPEASFYPRFATADNLVDVILGRAANLSPAEVGWRTVEVLNAAYSSAEHGGTAIEIAALYVDGDH